MSVSTNHSMTVDQTSTSGFPKDSDSRSVARFSAIILIVSSQNFSVSWGVGCTTREGVSGGKGFKYGKKYMTTQNDRQDR